MKKITMYHCEHCGQVFGEGETHDEAVCKVKQTTQAQMEAQDQYMSNVYLQDDSEGPLGAWKVSPDYTNLSVDEATHEAMECKEDGVLTKFRTFEEVRGTVELLHTRIQPRAEGELCSFHVEFDIHGLVLGEDAKLSATNIKYFLRDRFDVDANTRNGSDCQVDNITVRGII